MRHRDRAPKCTEKGRLLQFSGARQTRGSLLTPGARPRFLAEVNRWDGTRAPRRSLLSRWFATSSSAVPIIDADEPADFVFSVNGREPFNGWSRAKARLDGKAPGLNEPWQLRDLRRTARTLMSRNKTPVEIAERCLGHVMSVVRGTYDRYDYLAEKREAFNKLSATVESIVGPANASVGGPQ